MVSEPVTFGRYKVTSTLGRGAMGEVYAAVDDVLGRTVAVKTLRSGSTGLAARMLDERFRLEARAVAALNHPGIVQVYDLDLAANPPFLVMERMAGPSLADLIKAGALSPRELRALGIQIARALAAAHAAGIVHRDVKPGNILAGGPGVWKLADFGVAHVPDSSLTMTGQFIGSPAYAPPEALLRGQSVEAGDVFGLGATLYCAAAGRWPRSHAETSALLAPIPSVRTLVPDLPDDLVATIDCAVALEPARRPSAIALAEALASASPPPQPAPVLSTATEVLPAAPPLAALSSAKSTATEVLPATPPRGVATAFVPDATSPPPARTEFVADATAAPAPPRPATPKARPRWLPWAALAIAGGAVIAIAATRSSSPSASTPAAAPPTSPAVAPSPVVPSPVAAPVADEDTPEPDPRTIQIRRPRVTNARAGNEFEQVINEIYNHRYTYALDRLDDWERQWGATPETTSLRKQLEHRAEGD